jgi:hypothetical protein
MKLPSACIAVSLVALTTLANAGDRPSTITPSKPGKSSPASRVEPPLPEAKREAAHQLFRDAQAAAAAGDYGTAIGNYSTLYQIVRHPDILFNMAQVQDAAGDVDSALSTWLEYLPSASKDEKADIVAHIETLRATPGFASVKVSTTFGKEPIIFIDGVAAFRSKGTVSMTAGPHVLDAFSEVAYRSESCRLHPGGKRSWSTNVNPTDGNVVLSGNSVFSQNYKLMGLLPGKSAAAPHTRVELAAGTYQVSLVATGDKCKFDKSVTIPAKGVTFVFVTITPVMPADGNANMGRAPSFYDLGCGTATIDVQTIDFDMKLPTLRYETNPGRNFKAPKAGVDVVDVN